MCLKLRAFYNEFRLFIRIFKDINIPKLELADCVYKGEEISEEWPDESGIQPNAVDDEEKEEEEEDDEEGGKK